MHVRTSLPLTPAQCPRAETWRQQINKQKVNTPLLLKMELATKFISFADCAKTQVEYRVQVHHVSGFDPLHANITVQYNSRFNKSDLPATGRLT